MSAILVCGSRHARESAVIYAELANHIYPWDTVITGGAPGIDTITDGFARGLGCKTVVFHAEWERDGRKAGPLRNARMLAEGKPDRVIAFPGGRGTRDMVTKARAAGVPVVEVLNA